MPLPPASRKLIRNHPSLQHAYAIKVETKLLKLDTVLNGIFEVADGDLLVSTTKTILTNFSLNEKFAKKLKEASKHVAGLANRLSEKASFVMEKLDEVCDRKVNMQDIVHIEDVTDFKRKCPETKKHVCTKFVPSQDFRIKTEWISDDSDDDHNSSEKGDFSGELDGHFVYPKTNRNPAKTHSFICDHCQGVFRDRNELRNHYTNHRL